MSNKKNSSILVSDWDRRGRPVRVRGGDTSGTSTFVVDPQFWQLVDSYETAKEAAASDESKRATSFTWGNYDFEGDTSMPWTSAHRLAEHRLALALADATLARSRC